MQRVTVYRFVESTLEHLELKEQELKFHFIISSLIVSELL